MVPDAATNKTIQVVARGQEIMVKMQEDMNQHANVANPLILPVVETPSPPPQVDPLVNITAPGGVSHVNLSPHVVEIVNQHDAFFSPRAASQYDAFGPTTNEVEKKVKAIEEKLKEMESTNVLGLEEIEMCLVPRAVVPTKFKVPYFEKNKGNSDPRTHIRAYCRKMVAYSSDDRLLMHIFQDSLSGASLDWYMQLEGRHIRT
ncbi:uncharacterized protein LOC127100353 [Lathyrus oleraceus]|uniref:uncharacterized protein LOC127100353 n=1 Tax=Pisum sativum TaxID=3888 RepID=UPI0021D2A254|nr:uncharacterized protein LOC127100353 [Pisum sativum]